MSDPERSDSGDAGADTEAHTPARGAAPAPGAGSEVTAPYPEVAAGPGAGAGGSAEGRYQIIRPHARGGLGEVFVAQDTELNREVALKQILEKHADDPASRARFLLEAEVTGGLEHPGIVPVYGLGSDPAGRPFYAMRFVRGDSLKEAISQFHADSTSKYEPGRRSLELRKLLRRLLDVCNAIDYAHSRGVLHRDIKPGNVIIGRHGEALVVDWGLAKATGRADPAGLSQERPLEPASASGSAETLPGSALGTPAYMSPEQAAGDLEQLGTRSDVYSLGATLYCLLTGRPPFEGSDVRHVLQGVERGEFPPPRSLDASIDPALEAICLKAMARQPADRYETPRALSDEIERWMADEPVLARPETRAERLSRWMRRHRTWTQAGAAALAAVTAVSLAAALVVDRARRQESKARQAEAIARSDASTQRDQAEANFQLARRAVEDYLTRVSESTLLRAQDRQDLRELRKQLLEDALRYYQKFIAQRGDDPKERAALADAYSRVAFITDEIGSQAEALEAGKHALAIAEQLKREDPRSSDARIRLAKTLNDVGAIRRSLGAMDAALADHFRARTELEALSREHPTVAAYQHQLALSYNRIGAIRADTGKPQAALESYAAAQAIMEALVREHPAESKDRAFLGTLVNNVGLLRQDLDDLKGALRDYRRAADLFDALSRDQPGDPRWGNLGAAVHHDVGVILGELEGPRSGLRELSKALQIHLDVVRRHPTVSQFQDDLARTYISIGDLDRKAGDRTSALQSMQRSLEIREQLRRDNPGVFWYQNEVAASYLNIGIVQFEAGDFVAAERSFGRALAIQAPLVAANPDKPKLASTLGRIDYRLAQAQLATGRPRAAVERIEEAIKHHRAACERTPEFADFRRFLADDFLALAKAKRALGRPGEALAAARAGLEIAPDDADWLYEAAREVGLSGPQSAGEAMRILRRAIDAGFHDAARLASDAELAPIRSRADFLPLRMDVEFPANPFSRAE
jgi:serine/threonine-protein kinase